MSVAVITTYNETSFAVAYGDATALVLDAIATGGSTRRDLLTRAQDRLRHALLYAQQGNQVEEGLARQLAALITVWENNGSDRA